MNNDAVQLQLNLTPPGNRVRDWMGSGHFFVVIEQEYSGKTGLRSGSAEVFQALQDCAPMLAAVPVAAALTVPANRNADWDFVEFASGLEFPKDQMILYVPGRSHNIASYLKLLDHIFNAGFLNVVPVSGDGVPNASAKQNRAVPFTEGIHALYHYRQPDRKKPDWNLGTVINPFKYTPSSLLAQYHKMVKKINGRADFLVCNQGWDMHKLQELQWYMSHRNLFVPVLARLLFLSPERVDQILQEQQPGVHISPDFRIVLKNEARFSSQQFEFAQFRRLQILAAGCRFIGYNGIQISGLTKATQVKALFRMLNEAFSEFSTFDEWRTVYLEHLGRAEMAPYPHRFYLFKNLLSHARYGEYPAVLNPVRFKSVPSIEKMVYKLSASLLSESHRRYPDEFLLTKKFLTGCRQCSFCRLPLTFYICPETCPKGLANGPCGGSKPDGSCEFGSRECIHNRTLRLASWLQLLDILEERYIKAAEPIGQG